MSGVFTYIQLARSIASFFVMVLVERFQTFPTIDHFMISFLLGNRFKLEQSNQTSNNCTAEI